MPGVCAVLTSLVAVHDAHAVEFPFRRVSHSIIINPMKTEGPGATVTRAEFLNLFVAVFLPMFMAAVDQTLLATATPAIADSLGGLARQLVDRGRLPALGGGDRAGLRQARRYPRQAQDAARRARRVRAGLGRVRGGADDAAARRGARAAGARRRRAHDALARAHRRARAAGRARALPGLFRADVHAPRASAARSSAASW